jgi:formate dehydrogenase assembly factor FdhD
VPLQSSYPFLGATSVLKTTDHLDGFVAGYSLSERRAHAETTTKVNRAVILRSPKDLMDVAFGHICPHDLEIYQESRVMF